MPGMKISRHPVSFDSIGKQGLIYFPYSTSPSNPLTRFAR